MSKTVVIYWSGTGNTEEMAQAVLEGAKGVNPETKMYNVLDISATEALNYDTLILGCPSMGDEVLEESEFEPFFSEIEPNLSGKNVALFGSFGWGVGQWMKDWEDRVNSAKARLVNGEGLIVNGQPDEDAKARCAELGETAAKM